MLLALSMVAGVGSQAFASETAENELSDYNIIPVYSSAAACDVTENNGITDPFDVAIDAVKALNLAADGLGYIEEACLEELEFKRDQGVELESYAVLVPKAAKANPTYYGTYNNVDFYSSLVSLGNYGAKRQTYTNQDKIKSFLTGSANLVFCLETFANYAVPWTLLCNIASFPIDKVVTSSPQLVAKVNINGTNRVIYTKSLGVYQKVYSWEFGNARPYAQFEHKNPFVTPSEFTYDGPLYTYKDLSGTDKQNVLRDAYNVYTSGIPAISYSLEDRVSCYLK